MPLVVFEPTIPEFEQAKTFHALDRAATVIGSGTIRRVTVTSLMFRLAHIIYIHDALRIHYKLLQSPSY
jgi:hypothetical protein